MSNSEVLQRKLTRREFRERMQSGELKACQGEKFIKRIVGRVADYLQEMIAGKRVAEIPNYFP